MKTCLVRKYLQARIPQGFQRAGALARWAILGGTELRFVHTIPRFSEDLDFSTVSVGPDQRLRESLDQGLADLRAEGYRVDAKVGRPKAVASAFIRFPGLLYELGLASRASQVLSIKVVVDTNPPAGAGLETVLVRRHVLLNLCHHDKPSLLARSFLGG